MIYFTSPDTIALKAVAITTATARSSTFPLVMNFLKSVKKPSLRLFSFLISFFTLFFMVRQSFFILFSE